MARKISLNLDTLDNKKISTQCKQNDDLTLEVSIFENGIGLDLTKSYIMVQAKKSDNKIIIQDTDIIKEGNKIIVELNRDFTRISGVTSCEVVIIEEGKQNTTFTFFIIVNNSVIDLETNSENKLTVLERLENTVVEANITDAELKNTINTAKENNEFLKNTVNVAVEANAKAEENINNLNSENAAADTNIATLTLKNTKAEENITNLDTKNTEAVTNIKELDNKIAAAGEVKAETEQLIATGGAATKEDIATVNSSLEQIENNVSNDMSNVDFENFNAKALNYTSNALDYLVTPTYDGSGQTTHPKVLYFSNGWNGYKFWMAHTPYTNQTSAVENPSILASNDGITWTLPNGCPDPIENKPVNGYNSDAHLVMVDNTMEIWWRGVENNGGEKSYIRRRKSTDGITWSNTETLFIWGVTDVLSPSIIYEDGKYKMWYVAFIDGVAKVCFNESIDAKNWGDRYVYDIDFTSKYRPWHLDVIKTKDKYEMTVMVKDSGGIGDLMYTYSYDCFNFSKAVPMMYHTDISGNPQMTAWDRGSLYRSSLVWVEDKYYLFYSAFSYGSKIQHIGLCIGNTPYSLQYYKHSYTPITVYRNTKTDVAVINDGTPLDYKRNSITYDYLTKTYAENNGFPPYQGVLVTHNPSHGTGYLKQFYYVFRSNAIYTRNAINETTWTSWELMNDKTQKINYTDNTVLLTDTISSFPNDTITYNKITNSYASTNNFPEGQGGILVTENIKNTEAGWQKQTYTTYTSKNIYVRFYKSTGWTDWYKYNLELNGIKSGNTTVTGTTITAKSRYDFEIPVVGVTNTDTAIINFASALNVGLIANARCTTDKIIIEITNILDTDIIYSSRVVNYRVFKR